MTDSQNFEKKLARLQALARSFSQEELSFDEMGKRYAEAKNLAQELHAMLDEAELHLRMIGSDGQEMDRPEDAMTLSKEEFE